MLSLCFLLAAALATAGVYLFSPSLSLLWMLPIFVGGFVGAIVLYLIILVIWCLFLPKNKPIKQPKPICSFMIRITMQCLMQLLGIRVVLKGLEKMPNEPCVIVSNHLSAFDPMTMLAVMRGRKLVYISKESNFKIPIAGNFIYHAGFLAIDRSNGLRAMRTLERAGELMRERGVDVGIYPEGTRSRTGELLRFKPGAFVLAQNAQAPIVVMTTKGSDKLFKGFPFCPTRVELEVQAVIDKESVTLLSRDELMVQTREIIEEALKK
ncbi:MAG: 1-acyl-sn-glycerol-3-phosphate acyltransferase [Clostridia bacterium]|nr:1-acyl-sn-glycerol-3-phosphate acyltransferase [Clostridia bacterium]